MIEEKQRAPVTVLPNNYVAGWDGIAPRALPLLDTPSSYITPGCPA